MGLRNVSLEPESSTILPAAAWLHVAAHTGHELLQQLHPLSALTNPHPTGMREQTKQYTCFYTAPCPYYKACPVTRTQTGAGQHVQHQPPLKRAPIYFSPSKTILQTRQGWSAPVLQQRLRSLVSSTTEQDCPALLKTTTLHVVSKR